MTRTIAMAPAQRSVVREGVVAGLVGASVVAVWFLIYDTVRGQPLLTPSLLGEMVFRGTDLPVGLSPSAGPVLGYTLIHGLAFIAFGVIAATMMVASEQEPTLFVGFVILFACFEVFFFAVLGAVGQSLRGALVWWAVLVGNLLASLAMLWYLFRGRGALPGTLVGSWGGVVREGVTAGLIGAGIVAVWFFAIDAIQGELLRTPRLLGMSLLRQSSPAAALWLYSLVHGVAFVLFGVVGAFLIAGAERQPLLVFGLVILFTAFEVLFFCAVLIFASWVLDELAGWTIFVGNVLAATAMLAYYFRHHRALLRRVTATWAEDE